MDIEDLLNNPNVSLSEVQSALGRALAELASQKQLNYDLMANCNQLRDRAWKAEGQVVALQSQLKSSHLLISAIVANAGGEIRVPDVAFLPDYEIGVEAGNAETVIMARRA